MRVVFGPVGPPDADAGRPAFEPPPSTPCRPTSCARALVGSAGAGPEKAGTTPQAAALEFGCGAVEVLKAVEHEHSMR